MGASQLTLTSSSTLCWKSTASLLTGGEEIEGEVWGLGNLTVMHQESCTSCSPPRKSSSTPEGSLLFAGKKIGEIWLCPLDHLHIPENSPFLHSVSRPLALKYKQAFLCVCWLWDGGGDDDGEVGDGGDSSGDNGIGGWW